MTIQSLDKVHAGMPIVFGGDKVALVSADLAAAFQPGDRLLVAADTGALLHLPAREHAIAQAAVGRARSAFARMGEVTDDHISAFFDAFAANLADDARWATVAEANARDVASAELRGRSTTRLAATEAMRRDMIAGLQAWRDAPASRGRVVERVDHRGWDVEQVTAPLGVVGFVFEGRPNVFADATGVLRTGNTVVFRIGSDALGTAKAIVEAALDPALAVAGLPPGAAVLVESAAHAAGWALFADPRLALAVARGSGPAVSQLGAIARAAGTPVSLHGTGGAWMVADEAADADRLFAAVYHSLDRKVCNTLNTCCIVRSRPDLVAVFKDALAQAGERRSGFVLHEDLADPELGREWEWEDKPEVTLKIVDDLAHAADLFNRWSPRFDVSLISEDRQAHDRFFEMVDAPFVGDGFTRWVDGQYALNKPELGLSNWENGRLFARSGILSGDGVFALRARVRQTDMDLDRGGGPTPERRG